MGTLIRDLSYASRMLAKRPLWTLAAVLCLSLGVGGVTLIFSLVNGILLRPLAYEEPERLMMIQPEYLSREDSVVRSTAHELIAFREQLKAFASVAEMIGWSFNVTSGDYAERVQGGRVSASLFPLLGVPPQLGRTFDPEEEGTRAVVLSHGLWQRRFGGDPNVVGQSIYLSDNPFEILGVMPEGFSYLVPVDLWVPLKPNPRSPKTVRIRTVVGRLAEGWSPDQARAELASLAAALQAGDSELYPADSGFGIRAVALHEQITGGVRPHLVALFAAVGLVLLIACANLANLVMAQATTRQKEVALRSALGAGRWDIARQLLTESLLLAFLGGLAGWFLAWAGMRALGTLELGDLPRLGEVTIDWRVSLFALAISIATGALFGLAPVTGALKVELFETLKEGGKTSASGARRYSLRNALVVGEIALALVALLAAGLVVRSFQYLAGLDPGFKTGNLVTMQMTLPASKYRKPERKLEFYDQLRAGLERMPMVRESGVVSRMPMSVSEFEGEVLVEGWEGPNPVAAWQMVSSDYFRTMGIPLVMGRVFSGADHGQASPVVILDAGLARRIWGDENPVGRRLSLNSQNYPEEREVVGVVGQVRHYGLTLEPTEQLYIPYRQIPYPSVGLVVTAEGEPAEVASAVRGLVREIDPGLPISGISTAGELVSSSLSRPRLNRLLFGLFGGIALVLTAVGVYGVMAYTVSLRTSEIALRMALGAQSADVVKLVLRQGAAMTGLGLAVGLVAAGVLGYLYSQLVASVLYGVRATDPITLVAVPLVVAALALLATFLPAWRASRVDPMSALRQE